MRCTICNTKKATRFTRTYGDVCDDCLNRMFRRTADIMKAKQESDKLAEAR